MQKSPLALALALAITLFGCNTAQVIEAPVEQDAGPACQTDVSRALCDAGGVTLGCLADPDSGFAAARKVQAGDVISYGCKVTLSEVVEVPQQQCSIFSECTCEPPDASAEGGPTGGQWSCSTAR
jgi:hypothetical protein